MGIFRIGIWKALCTDGKEGRQNTPQGKEGVTHIPRDYS